MTVTLERSAAIGSVLVPPPRLELPTIRREGITWRGGVGGEPLTIELTFENPAPYPSASTQARIGIAAFGAFLPWRPLTLVSVPSIPPGGRVLVAAAADIGRPVEPHGSWNDRISARIQRFSQQLGLQAVHFVGNINVHVDASEPVERHLERAIDLQAGRENVALFAVGDNEDDSYTFQLEAEPGWKVDLDPIPLDVAIRCGSLTVPVSIIPPARAKSGRVAVWVRRESRALQVPVEFELVTRAGGARCYRL